MTLLDAIAEHGFDAAFGGARRDEERARAKERIFSLPRRLRQWDPKSQRPELWNLYNGRIRRGEHVRVFPLSNWTELDVWQYIAEEQLELPSIYFAHEREVFARDGMLYAMSDFVELIDGEEPFTRVGALPHRRRHDAAPARCARRPPTLDDGHRRDRRDAGHRARRDARRRPRRPRPRWKTASARATSDDVAVRRARAPAELLRFATAGSVDDGKSTLIGRLLYDTKAIFEDQLDQVADVDGRDGEARPRAAHRRPARRARAGHHDRRRLPLLRDAAAQVHHRRHARPRAVHAQHGHRRVDGRPRRSCWSTRATGCVEQTAATPSSRRCCGIPHIVFAVNKMDLVDWDEDVFDAIVRDFCDVRARTARASATSPSSRSAR